MELERLIATERRLREPLCSLEYTEEYCVFKSDSFPGYYGANGVEILRNNGRTLSDWEHVFEQHFGTDVYQHKTFSYTRSSVPETLIEEARQAGYDVVQIDAWMYAREPLLDTDLPADLRVGCIRNSDDWERYRTFSHTVNKDEGWYTPSGCDNLFRKAQYVSGAVGIEWFYLANGDVFTAVMGVFLHKGIARLQDVVTHPLWRRRGLATHLLCHVFAHAKHTLAADALALCADVDYVAIDLYKKMGFVAVGETVDLIKFP